MNIKIFADGSNIKEIFDLYENNKLVKGFTTNPSLMKKAGVTDYGSFIKEVTSKIKNLSISFEVFADDEKEMIYQANKIASFGENIHVKIPITNTKGQYTLNVIESLVKDNIKVNVTAVFTQTQINLLKTVLPNNKDIEDYGIYNTIKTNEEQELLILVNNNLDNIFKRYILLVLPTKYK